MRTLWAWGLLAALALPARADIVDSGTLTIGGQGVIGGTFTVQGNALGVAGSVSATSATLSGNGANIFSLTTSSGIHILSGGITWPDGKTSTTSAGGGGGNVLLSATQTFSGANTFLSTVSIGGAIAVGNPNYTLTADYSSVVLGGCAVVASTNPAADTGNWTFSGLRSTGTYELRIFGIMGAGSAFWNVTINGDSGANYTSYTVNPNGNASTTTSLLMSLTSGVGLYPADGTPYYARLELAMPYARTSNYVSSWGQYYYRDQNGGNDPGIVGGNYSGNAPMTSLTVSDSNKVFTGTLTLLYCSTSNGPF